MNKANLAVSIAIAVSTLLPHTANAKAPPSSYMLRDAFSAVTDLNNGEAADLTGTNDGEDVFAKLTLDDDGKISALSLMQGDRMLQIPDGSWNMMSGARRAWLEERGSMTTLVVEGEDGTGDWRLALMFHTKQLRKRRLSREGEKHDEFIFYGRDADMKPTEPKRREANSRGFYNR